MNLNLKGKTVVVTGAAGGMGLATIKLLLDYNVKILALDIQKPTKKILQHKKITYCIDIKRLINKDNKHIVWADGAVTTDKNKTIYFAKNLQVGLFDNLTYDFGADPSLDAF